MQNTNTNTVAIALTAPHIEQRLREKLNPSQLEVIDESYLHAGHVGASETGQGSHFRVKICSAQFSGLSKVASHRLVYSCLTDFFNLGLHALALETQATSASATL